MPDSPRSAWQGSVEDSRRAEESDSSGAAGFDGNQEVLHTEDVCKSERVPRPVKSFLNCLPVTPQCGDPTDTTPRSGRAGGPGTAEAGPKPGSSDGNTLT